MTLKPTVSIVLDIRKSNVEKLFPIKLRATFVVVVKGKKKWLQKYYSLKRFVSKKDYTAIRSGTARTYLQKEIRTDIQKAEEKANFILDTHTHVTPELFERLFNGPSQLEGVAAIFDFKIAELEKDGRVGSVGIYKAVKNSIEKFSQDVTFFEITVDWLRRYESWLRSHKEEDKTVSISATTVGIYLRHLRAIFNLAIRMKLINNDLYPFGRGLYVIKKTQARKIALSEVDKNRLLSVTDPEMRYAVDFWMFSYFCYGLNMTDIALLKLKDLKNDVIIIGREKKKNTDLSGKMLVIPVRKEIKDIIIRWGNKTLNPEDYVFPVLTDPLTPRQIKNRVKDFTKDVNDGLRKVQEKLKLETRLTTYTARHTFAMMALRKGASKEFIQDALGHSSMMTTESYLSGFDIEAKIAISAKL